MNPRFRHVSWTGLCALVLLSGCVYVRVRTDLEEGRWLDEILDEVHDTPASFRRGETNLRYRDLLWDRHGTLEMDFQCDEDELDDYLDAVGEAIEHEIERRDCEVVSLDDRGLSRTYAYDGDRSGEVEVEIETSMEAHRYAHRLIVTWEEDGWRD